MTVDRPLDVQTGGATLVADRDFPWSGGNPYMQLSLALGQKGLAGLSPESGKTEINDCMFDLMPGAGPSERAAWDALRLTVQRSVVDFLHYPLQAHQTEWPSLRLENISWPPDVMSAITTGPEEWDGEVKMPAALPLVDPDAAIAGVGQVAAETAVPPPVEAPSFRDVFGDSHD
ncbi:MAG: hypothetical protein MRY64_15410 [Hyphomonadaceae bacterium]|nr:hypothetical protein [Hyphomonadaceae bacterium]